MRAAALLHSLSYVERTLRPVTARRERLQSDQYRHVSAYAGVFLGKYALLHSVCRENSFSVPSCIGRALLNECGVHRCLILRCVDLWRNHSLRSNTCLLCRKTLDGNHSLVGTWRLQVLRLCRLEVVSANVIVNGSLYLVLTSDESIDGAQPLCG